MERRQQNLLRAKDNVAKRARISADLSSPNLDTFNSGCEKESKGGAVSVWRGGQGGAFAPPNEPKFRAAALTKNMALPYVVKKEGGMPEKFLENPFLDPLAEATGVHTVSKKRRVLAQVCIAYPSPIKIC